MSMLPTGVLRTAMKEYKMNNAECSLDMTCPSLISWKEPRLEMSFFLDLTARATAGWRALRFTHLEISK